MKRKRHTPEEIVRRLREAEVMQSEGRSPPEIAKAFGVSEQTLHRWRNQFGGMKGPEMKRLKELESENARLKKLVADLSLDKEMLRELAKGEF